MDDNHCHIEKELTPLARGSSGIAKTDWRVKGHEFDFHELNNFL